MLESIPPHRYRPHHSIIQKAQRFAASVVDTVNYGDSRQVNRRKIGQDHFISKIGEEAVYSIFCGYFSLVKPDYRIYQGKQKSWDADLKINGQDLAVKTQAKSSATRYGLSWMFQWGRFRKDQVLNDPHAWVCFVQCNDTDGTYNCTVYSPLQIKDIIFGEPKLSRLRGEKKVVYANSNPHIYGKKNPR